MLTIYKASAGSGKTFTLAFEYIKTLLGVKELPDGAYHLNSPKYNKGVRQSSRHRSILAITFTNAATEEMKSRIVRELAALAEPANAAGSLYGRWLVRDFGCTPDELADAAGKALSEVLYDYGGFNVSTIDSFFQTVLRTFSREVDHQGDFQLELDAEAAMKQSVSMMLDEMNYLPAHSRGRLSDWIQNSTISNLNSGQSTNFFNRDSNALGSLTRAMARAMDETYATYADSLRQYLADPARLTAFAAELKARSDAIIGVLRRGAREFFAAAADIPEDLFQTYTISAMRAYAAGNIPRLSATCISVAKGESPLKKLIRASALKGSGYKAEDLEPLAAMAATVMETAIDSIPHYNFYTEIAASLGALDFFSMAHKRLEDYLRENNMVLIADTGDMLRGIISDAEMPFIYERLGMKLDTLLIDEFQDTSHLQWHNLRPLVANSLAEGHDSLIIGDEKQAIYRFRNSDSALLGSIVQTRDFPTQHVLRGFDPADNTNHRSAADIVRFNNAVLAAIAHELSASSYANVEQTPSPRKLGVPAYIKIQFDDQSTDDVLEDMAREILRQHNEGGYRWRDILILTRKRSEASRVVDFLIKKHPEIEVLSSEALLLSSSSAVRSIMSMLRLVEGSFSQTSRPQEQERRYASNADIVDMMSRFNYYITGGLDATEALERALSEHKAAVGAETLDEEIRRIRAENSANLVVLIDAIIRHKLSPQQRRDEHAYITALQDLAIKHAESADASISAFLDAYSVYEDRWAIKASADMDAVEVMTVHKSKGLERDCVHIPFADWEMAHGTQSAWVPVGSLAAKGFDPEIIPPVLRLDEVSSASALRDPAVSPFADIFSENERLEQLENLNTAYVAFTRASRELCVHSTTSQRGFGHYLADIIEPKEDGAAGAVSHALPDSARYDSESRTFEIGEPTEAPAYEAPTGRVDAGEYPVIFSEKARRITAIDDVLSASLDIGGEADKETVDTVKPYQDRRMALAAEQGNALHSILASMQTLDDLDRAIAHHGRRGFASTTQLDQYRRMLVEAFDSAPSVVKTWFAPELRVLAERDIFEPSTQQTYRPDRVVVFPDGSTLVIDYKFTTEPHASHVRQVQKYISLLGELGYRNVRGWLWYPLLKLTKEV